MTPTPNKVEAPELLACPACDDKDCFIAASSSGSKVRAVMCDCCGMQGPRYSDPEMAVMAWNELPRIDYSIQPSRTPDERIAGLVSALEWYGEQARLARLIHSEGDAGRHALAEDGGKLARSILLKEPKP